MKYMPEGAVSLSNLPAQLAIALGFDSTSATGLFAGQVCATLIFTCLFLFPTLFLSSKFKRDALIPSVVVGFMGLVFGVVAFGLSYWFLLILGLFVALMFAGSMRDWITGHGR